MTELPEEAVEAGRRAAQAYANSLPEGSTDAPFIYAHRSNLVRAVLAAAAPHLPAYTVERELREALEKAATALDIPDHKLTDTVFLRGASLCAKAFVSAAIAALSRAPAPERTVMQKDASSGAVDAAVYIKRLEWRHLPDAFPPMWVTKTTTGSYHIEESAGSDSPSFDLFNPMAGPMGNYEGLDEAKATAQADYETRILSALAERTVAPAEPVAADEIQTESMGEFLLAAFLTYLADGNTIMSSAALALDKHEQAYEPASPPALPDGLAEHYRTALASIAHTFTEGSHGNTKTMPASWYQEQAARALASAPQPVTPALPDGWRAVPIKPTDDMDMAGGNAVDYSNPYQRDVAANVWAAMLASAPMQEDAGR